MRNERANPSLKRRIEWRIARVLQRRGYHLTSLSPYEISYLRGEANASEDVPPAANEYLRPDHPRLQQLLSAYRHTDFPLDAHTHWSPQRVLRNVDLRHFRGETMYLWQNRDSPRITSLRYFVYAEYVRGFDQRGLLTKLGEDGAFGCWTFDYEGRGRYSRDLLDSVNELYFLHRHLGILDAPRFHILDIGAGYGRLAHRACQAIPAIGEYCCVDAVALSTFLCEYYLGFRSVVPPARIITLDRMRQEAEPGRFDLAINIHSFPECSYAAIEWWIRELVRLRVPNLFLVPNDGDQLLTWEHNGTRRDFAPLLRDAGYELIASEPMLADPAVRSLLDLHDHFMLFRTHDARSPMRG